jgi:predicted DsbA family dithiol-disulfide isomerase
MKKATISMTIVSDVVCPWCYIGKRRLEKAMEWNKDRFDFIVRYVPFELNPELPIEGIHLKQHLVQKFGSLERYNQIVDHVTQVAAQEGLNFDFTIQHMSPNTRKAHQLLAFAATEGKQAELKEAFLSAYFEKGIDLTKTENLIDIALTAGLPSNAAREVLSENLYYDQVAEEESRNHERGIRGVPFYIINQHYGLSGAQPPEVFSKVFAEIESTQGTAPRDGCDVVPGDC